jgi:uncharacterized membrane protein YdjX (TVP38/TMEM64 family)
VRGAALLAIVVLLAWAHRRGLAGGLFSVDGLRALAGRHAASGLVIISGAVAAAILLHVPAFLVTATGAVVLGPWLGLLAGWIGGMVGAAVAFQITRQTAQVTVQEVLLSRSQRLRALDGRLAESGFRTVLLLRLVLYFSPPLNWAIGLSRVPFSSYLGATAIGVLPTLAATCYAGDAVARAASPAALLEPRILAPLVAVIAAVAAGALWGRRALGK